MDHLGAVFFPIDRAGAASVGRDVEFVEDLLEDIGAARAIHVGLVRFPFSVVMAAADAAVGVFQRGGRRYS